MSVWNSVRFWQIVEVTAVKTAGRDDIAFLYCPKAENIQVLCGSIPGRGRSKHLFTFDRKPMTAKVRMLSKSAWWTRVLVQLHAGVCVCGINYKSRSNLEIAASQDAHPRMGESVGHYLFQAAQLRSVLTACITLEKDGADESTQFQGFLKVFGLCTSWFVRSIPAQKNISSPYRTSSKMECFISKDAALQQVIFFDKNGKAQRQ